MKYEAVIFDLFGTLVEMCPWTESENILRQMAREISIPPSDFINLWHLTFDDRMKGVFQSYQDCIRHICQQCGAQVPENQIEIAASIRFAMTKREISSIREGAIEVLSSLKSTGYKTGLISDCSSPIPVIWPDTPFAPLIDVTIFSCSVKLKKPDPRIFQMAVDQLNVRPQDCLYIADGIDQELANASKLGMNAFMICTPNDRADDPYRENWSGLKISSLKEVLNLVKYKKEK